MNQATDCPFCNLHVDQWVDSNQEAIAFYDRFPVSNLHSLIIPKRHVITCFELSNPEVLAIHELLRKQKHRIEALDSSVTGFNIGVNCGADSGQTVFHCHFHLIPRRKGDVSNPRGGIRHMISGKGDYLSRHHG